MVNFGAINAYSLSMFGVPPRKPADFRCASFICSLLLFAHAANAHNGPQDDSCDPNSTGINLPTGIIGEWWKTWNQHGELGCPLSPVLDHPEGDGRYMDFERGQIVWSQGANLIMAGYGTATSGIAVRWKVTARFNYDVFNIRWDKDGGSGDQANSIAGADRTSGSYTIATADAGRYRIVVEGCDEGGFLQKDKCRPGFSLPAYVDFRLPDFAHKIDGTTLEPAADVASARSGFRDRLLVAAKYKCLNGFPDYSDNGNEFVVVALAKLVLYEESPVDDTRGPCWGKTRSALRQEINDALRGAAKKSDREVGTEIAWTEGALALAVEGAGAGAVVGAIVGSIVLPGIGTLAGAGIGALIGLFGGGTAGAILCHHKGDYDMTLRGLMPIVYAYSDTLDTDTMKHIVHDLLTESGGAQNVRLNVSICGLKLTETENHVWMTESSRYLTNQLLLAEVEAAHQGDPQSPELALARKRYGNTQNGLEQWMLQRLQAALQSDFHEYNARPYARLTITAIRNLAEYADNGDPQGRVRLAAESVLDYLAGKFAASNNNLRRAAPFRRRDEHWTYGPLYGNNSDEFTSYFLSMFGDTRLLQRLRYGRADWAAPDPVLFSGIGGYHNPRAGAYQVPDLILDLAFHRFDTPYVQTIRHEALELYASQGDFLISGGGIWVDDFYTHFVGIPLASLPGPLAALAGDNTHGFPMPTTLMSSWEGTDRNDFVRIAGGSDDSKRANTCVAQGFACGMNPVIPKPLYRRIHSQPRPCAHSVPNQFQQKWNSLMAEQGPLGCPIEDAHPPSEGGGLAQTFERGQIMWSPKANNDRFLQTAYLNSDNDIVFEWGDTAPFHYDFFIVRWDKNGSNAGQHDVQSDDANASPHDGGWTVPTSGPGRYRIVVEGCDGHFLGSSTCRQGWSNPIFLDLPLANSCVFANGDWTFLDLTGECAPLAAPDQRGFYVAVHSNQCNSSECSDAAGGSGSYGFFEAAAPTSIGFNGFQQTILQNNAGRVWSWAGDNEYVASDGRHIFFNPHSGPGRLGVTRITGPVNIAGSTNIDDYSLARGDLIEADGKGCILLKNKRLGQALILLMKNNVPSTPRTVPLSDGLSCSNLPAEGPRAPLPADTCKNGFVWREAMAGDHVCVTPQTRQATQQDNQLGPSRRNPNGGPFGPDTCAAGFVWREITPSDHVCVSPDVRAQARADNEQAASRRAQ